MINLHLKIKKFRNYKNMLFAFAFFKLLQQQHKKESLRKAMRF